MSTTTKPDSKTEASDGAGQGAPPKGGAGVSGRSSPVSGNPLLALLGDDSGLKFKGLVITEREVRSGIANQSKKPYAIGTQKVMTDKKTMIYTVMGDAPENLPPEIPVGTVIEVDCDSADRRSRDSDVEISGKIVSPTGFS